MILSCRKTPSPPRGNFSPEQNLDAARPTLFIQPFTSSPQKNWPLENYLALARHWRSRGLQIIFGGGPADRAALEPARAEGFCISAGPPLLVSAGLAKLSSFMLGGDSGLGPSRGRRRQTRGDGDDGQPARLLRAVPASGLDGRAGTGSRHRHHSGRRRAGGDGTGLQRISR